MKARKAIGAAFLAICLSGFGCETASPRSRVSYPEDVMEGSGDSMGHAMFTPEARSRIEARRNETKANTAVAGAEENADR